MTLDDLWALCVGEIGMSIEDYLESTWRELMCTVHGYRNRVRYQLRASWTQARMIAYFALAPHVKANSIRGPESLFKLEGDEDDRQVHKFPEMTNAERMEAFKLFGLREKLKHEHREKLKNKNGKPR